MTQYITLSKHAKDMTGQKFGRLAVLGPIGKRRRCIVWLCVCDCGNALSVSSASLRSGNTQSCGCLHREIVRGTMMTHGMKNDPLYRTWIHIKDRCYNSNTKYWKNYGGRGITVCDEWLQSFESFYDYASHLPHCDEEGYSIDRIFNDGNYEPGNVKFSTVGEQNRNKRSNRMITHDGSTMCLSDWAELVDIQRQTLGKRLFRLNWDVERALTTPVKKMVEK